MRITARYFAVLRERKGTSSEEVEVPDGLSVAEVYRHLFRPADVPVAYAVNTEAVAPGTPVHEGDELAFLPPVGGG
jgi:molybdopterin converting factor small subunit